MAGMNRLSLVGIPLPEVKKEAPLEATGPTVGSMQHSGHSTGRYFADSRKA